MPVVILSDAFGQTVQKTGFSAVAVRGISSSPPHPAVTCSVSCRGKVQESLDFCEMTSGIFRISGMLRSTLDSPSCVSSFMAATCSVSCCGRVQETLDLLGDDFRYFPYFRYASFNGGFLVHASGYGALAHGSHLFGAVCCSGAVENEDFLGDSHPGLFPHSALFFSTVVHVWRQFTSFWVFHVFST